MKKITATRQAIDAIGGRERAADLIGISRQAVDKWVNGQVPAKRVLLLEKLSGISRHDLRPDIFGPAAKEDRAA